MAAEKGDALGAPLSPITHCWSRMSQAPSALESLWKKISSFMAEKIPRKAFSTPPPPPHKGKLSEPAPHHPRGIPDSALGANTGVLDANLQIREVGQAKIFPLTAPGRGARRGLSRMRARRETQQPVHGRGHGGVVGGEDSELCQMLPQPPWRSANSSGGKELRPDPAKHAEACRRGPWGQHRAH